MSGIVGEDGTVKKYIRRVPLPMSGVMLGFAALGNFLKSRLVPVWVMMECAAVFLLLLLLLKIFLFPRETAADMGNAAIAGASGTFSMGLMFLSVSATSLNRSAGAVLWGIGLLLHILLILYFTVRFVLSFRLRQVYPSWFLVYVGIVAAAATGGAFGMQRLGRALLCWGLSCTAVLMVIVTVRYLRIPPEEPLRPLAAIYAAPVSLCLVGYFRSFDGKSLGTVLILAVIAHIFYVFGLTVVIRMIGTRFYPSFSAFTFPFINTAIATKLGAAAAAKAGAAASGVLQMLAGPECAVGTALLLIVFVRYLQAVFFRKDAAELPLKTNRHMEQNDGYYTGTAVDRRNA